MCLEQKMQQVRHAWLTLDVENQVANFCLKYTAFKRKHKLSVIYLKMENCNEAMNQGLSELKARGKVGMKHFNVKMTKVFYFCVSKGLSQTYKHHKPWSNLILICLGVKQHVCKFQRCAKRLKCWKQFASRLFRCYERSSQSLQTS